MKLLININLPGYTFFHVPSTTKAGGVGAYFSNNLKVSVKDNFGLYVQECEDLWFDVKFPGQNNNHIFALIYRHPHNNLAQFLNALDEKLALFNTLKSNNVYTLGDVNIDLNPSNTSSNTLDYSRLLQSHAYFSLITTPTRVTTTSQTVIDHISTNDNSSIIHPGVLLYKISDHFPIYGTISQPISNKSHFEAKHTYRNIHSVDGDKFRSDLELLTSPILQCSKI